MSKLPLSQHEKLLIMQSITWLKTMNEARPAGSPPKYPKASDIDTSALFNRIRAGLTPMPWAPPTRNGRPAYDLIENARGERLVVVEADAGPDQVTLDGAAWRVLARDPGGRDYRLAFGNWPLSYRAIARDVKRWPDLPHDLDQGNGQELVRLGDGRLLSKEVLRRERDLIQTQWHLRCCSPLNEHLYLAAQRLPLDNPANFTPEKIHVGSASWPAVFECNPFSAEVLVLFALCQDPWTKVTRYLALPVGDGARLDGWLEGYRQQQSPTEFDKNARSWRVFEIADDGRPLSAWETTSADLLKPLPELAVCT
jgi:hypothetical protein